MTNYFFCDEQISTIEIRPPFWSTDFDVLIEAEQKFSQKAGITQPLTTHPNDETENDETYNYPAKSEG